MARTGSFGRLPRAVPSLTNTLIAIAREEQQQEDQNIMNAWQKGGLVEGHKVTDGMVLKHWRDRLKDISKDDPLYDTYRMAVTQYEYSIAESKMTAQYALLKDPSAGDDGKMSAFYLNWSKRIPKDSEFYRILQRDAGQYIRSAESKRRAKTQQNEEKVYQQHMSALEKKNELPGQSMLRTLTLLGQASGVIGQTPQGMPTDVVNHTNIADLQLPGVDQLIAMIQSVNTPDHLRGPRAADRAAGSTAVIYQDENGKPVTGRDIMAQFKQLDPTFTGKFDVGYVQGLISDARNGIGKRIALAKKTGHISDAMQLSLQQAKLTEYADEVAAYPVAQKYNDLHADMAQTLKDIDSGKLTPAAGVAAIDAIRAKMATLSNDPRVKDDVRLRNQLVGEAQGKAGGLTLNEDLEGTRNGYTVEADGKSEIDTVNDQHELMKTQADEVASGTMVYTQGTYETGSDGKRVFVPGTGGPSVGAATMEQINDLPGAGKPSLVMLPNGDGGGATPLYVVPAPIKATATDEHGNTVAALNGLPAGSFVRFSFNGVDTTLYSKDGKPPWSSETLWDKTKVKSSMANGVITLDLSGVVPTGVDLNVNKDFGTGFTVVGAHTEKDGTIVPGVLSYDPTAAMLWSDAAHVHAGSDPNTDTFSISLAALKKAPDGAALLNAWTGTPAFEAILEQNAHLAAGQTYGMQSDGSLGWAGGDVAAYNANITTLHTDIANAKGGNLGTGRAVGGSWDRTGESPWKSESMSMSYAAGSMGTGEPPWALPTTIIKAEGGDHFGALANAATPGNNFPAGLRGDNNTPLVPSIKTGANLVVPGYTQLPGLKGTDPGVAPAPATTPTTAVPTAPSTSYTNNNVSGKVRAV